MLVPKAFIDALVSDTGTQNFHWGWCLMLVPKAFIGCLVPDAGTLNFYWWVGACCWYLKL